MKIKRTIIAFDADDLAAESAFWAAMVGGTVVASEDDWHDVIDADGNWHISVQHAPGLRRAEWPDGTPQQIHLDLHVDDIVSARAEALRLGATLLQETIDIANPAGFQVLADPAGHPFCLCWGH